MFRVGKGGEFWTSYILRTDRRLIWNVIVWDPRHNSDHYLILGCLCSDPLKDHPKYLGRRKCLPLRLRNTLEREDGLFLAIQ